jgi:sugar phosphate isomerase/epimerase
VKYGITVSTMATEQRPATFGDGRAAAHFPGIRELGYHGVDLFIKPLPAQELEALRDSVRASGLDVSVIFPIILFESGMSLSDPDREARKKAVDLYKTQIDLASYLGADIVLGLERGSPVEGESGPRYQQRLAGSLTELAGHADGKRVTIFMEPIHRFLVQTFHRVEQCLEFFEKHGLDSMGLLLDTFHMNIEERSIEQAIRLAGGRIGHVHAVENNRGAPGDGHLDFFSIVMALRDAGYGGYLSVETRPAPDPYAVARRGIAVLRGIVETLGA